MGVGAVIRNQVAAIVGTMVWLLLGEVLLVGFAPGVGRFSPGLAADAMTGDSTSHLLPPLVSAGTLLLYVTAAGAAGSVVTLRRDVP